MKNIHGCGLGLREEFIFEINNHTIKPSWLEITPENWMHTPKKYQKTFDKLAEDFKFVCHGLSLSIGSYEDLNMKFLKLLKEFLDRYNIEHYSEHLSFTSLNGIQSYELLPLPMNKKEVDKIKQKVQIVQDYLKRELILENATYYYVPSSTMSEIEFINEIFDKTGAKMLLDINNVFVNSHNHNFNPYKYVDDIDFSKVAYYHVAGHLEYKKNLWIDTHGMPVKDDVWELSKYVLKKKKAPILLERDNNIPRYKNMIKEYNKMEKIYENI
jgi:uncharacterized protein (UPF0276 family)